MKTSILWRVASLVTIALALSSQGRAQSVEKEKLGGAINDYTAALDAGGPWGDAEKPRRTSQGA